MRVVLARQRAPGTLEVALPSPTVVIALGARHHATRAVMRALGALCGSHYRAEGYADLRLQPHL